MENNLKLLFVDDDADDRRFFIEAVKEINDAIECTVAKDGLYALEMLNGKSCPYQTLFSSICVCPVITVNAASWK